MASHWTVLLYKYCCEREVDVGSQFRIPISVSINFHPLPLSVSFLICNNSFGDKSKGLLLRVAVLFLVYC